uniref:NACHT domain-containing protein n=1 Tax=Sinocyclocheilus grahami TaxID=75366 RepID=A0A672ST51_SINGR
FVSLVSLLRTTGLYCQYWKKHQSVSEGIAKQGDSKLLKNIYTDLYMTLSVSKQVNIQNEAGQVQAADRRHESQEIPVECKNLFEAPEQDNEIRTVLTKGVAGIGKSVSVQKFIVDWADGKENEDVTFIFPLAFREMNLKEKETQSLTSLIRQFFPEIKGLNLARNDQFKLLFILDGLDECRLPLNFEGNETCRDVSSQVSLDVLLTNLIKGNLLPSALIWIPTSPAAAIKIPPECINRVTEVQGFNDAQKKEYFRKRFTDADLANEIIDYVKQSKSLFIMCYIPVFCWISKINNDLKNSQADDASKILQESNTEDIPKTLTQMYTHFLRFQILQSRRKYDGEYTPDVSWDKDAILSLGRLAFHQLQRNNLLFYDTDLESCGIDASQASVYSSMCTQMFKEEKGIILGTTFCFVHLSIQEFIAALYAHLFLDLNKKTSVYSSMCTQMFKEEKGIILGTTFCFVHLSIQEFIAALYAHLFLDLNKKSVFDHHESTEQENKNETMIDLLKTAVDKALESETGHLDLFLRFLLGLSLQTNRPLLRGLLTQQDEDKKMSPERFINLFYCLNELNDQTLVNEIQTQLREGSLSSGDLSPAQWSAVAFVLLTSEEEMDEFDLQKFKKSDECLFSLNNSYITDKDCRVVAEALNSNPSNLKELDLTGTELRDTGMKIFSTLFENKQYCRVLAEALNSNPSNLKELDLTGTELRDTGMKIFSTLCMHSLDFILFCSLLYRFNCICITKEGCAALTAAFNSNPSNLMELDLSENPLGDPGVTEISTLLGNSQCTLKILSLRKCGLTEESCSALATVLRSNSSLKELDMSNNNLQDSGVKKLQNGLENTNCTLQKLMLNKCNLTDKSCSALATVLGSDTNLKELNMSNNNLQDSGVKLLCTGLESVKCKLEILR